MTACPNRCVLFCKRGHYRTSTSIDGRGNCKRCRVLYSKEYRLRHLRQYAKIQRKARLKREYSLSIERYTALLTAQNGRCVGCGVEKDNLAVDHDHVSGKIRGLLCNHCNIALGYVKDSQETLKNLAEYLAKFAGGTLQLAK